MEGQAFKCARASGTRVFRRWVPPFTILTGAWVLHSMQCLHTILQSLFVP